MPTTTTATKRESTTSSHRHRVVHRVVPRAGHDDEDRRHRRPEVVEVVPRDVVAPSQSPYPAASVYSPPKSCMPNTAKMMTMISISTNRFLSCGRPTAAEEVRRGGRGLGGGGGGGGGGAGGGRLAALILRQRLPEREDDLVPTPTPTSSAAASAAAIACAGCDGTRGSRRRRSPAPSCRGRPPTAARSSCGARKVAAVSRREGGGIAGAAAAGARGRRRRRAPVKAGSTRLPSSPCIPAHELEGHLDHKEDGDHRGRPLSAAHASVWPAYRQHMPSC